MRPSSVIGGEFEIDLGNVRSGQTSSFRLKNCYKYSSGRSALYYILLDITQRYRINKLFLPDYLCPSIVFAAKSAGFEILFYELNEKLELDKQAFANIYQKDSAVLIINYFGLTHIDNQISYIKTLYENAIIIEDDVQAYYEFEQDLMEVNYKFTSLRKTFAVPDGGFVKAKHMLSSPNSVNKFCQYKIAGGILKFYRSSELYDDDIYLSLFEKGEELIDDDLATGMSEASSLIFANTDVDFIANARRNNAKTLVSGLETLGIRCILPLSDESVPLFIPVYLEARDKVRRNLFQHNVFCPVHWPTDGMTVKKGNEMATHELSIVVDQRYTACDMNHILNLLEQIAK